MSEPNTVDIERRFREKSEEFVLKPHLSGELTIGLSVWRCHLLKFQQPAAVLGEARDGISHYVGDCSEMCIPASSAQSERDFSSIGLM